MTDTQFRKSDVVRFKGGKGEYTVDSATSGGMLLNGPEPYRVFMQKDFELVYRPPTREEHERQARDLTEMRDALIAWAKEERKSGEPGFSTAPMMRLIHLGQRLLAEEEAANNV